MWKNMNNIERLIVLIVHVIEKEDVYMVKVTRLIVP